MLAAYLHRIAIGLLAGASCARALGHSGGGGTSQRTRYQEFNGHDPVNGSTTIAIVRIPESLPAIRPRLEFDARPVGDAETVGSAYVGFIAGVLSANPSRAESLVAKMLVIDPADHWVLVRAVAYSGLPHWKDT